MLVDREAEEVLARYPWVLGSLRATSGEISLGVPGEMHFRVFENEQMNAAGIWSYLASDKAEGRKVLILSGDEKYRWIFKGLDYEVGVITSEMGAISEYGGVGKYMRDLLPYLSESFRVIEIGWEGIKVQQREMTWGEFLAEYSHLPFDKHLDDLVVRAMPKSGSQGYEVVRQTYELSAQMAEYLVREHPETMLVYFQTWYNGMAVPVVMNKLPHAAVAVIFHSVQPNKP